MPDQTPASALSDNRRLDVCEWQRLWSGESLCDQPAAYIVVYDGCEICPGDSCQGAGICVEHAAVERERATEVGLIGIRSVAS